MNDMKNATLLLAAAALVAAPFALHTHLAAPGQSNSPAVSQPRFVLKPIPLSAVHHSQTGAPRLRFADQVSGNWSGYAVPYETGPSDTFSYVQGTWKVPSVTAGLSRRAAADCSGWVGLDGYDDATVELTGTEQDWTGSAQQNYAWFEMYPGGAYEIEVQKTVRGRTVTSPAPVSAGDTMSASVSYVGSGVFALTIMNHSTTHGWTYTAPATYTTSATATRASAEWIMEAPYSNEILPLANFGSPASLFSDCAATGSAGVLSPISAWANDPLQMVDPEGGVSTPSALTLSPDPGVGDSFTAAWTK